jgi:hypothetical protein
MKANFRKTLTAFGEVLTAQPSPRVQIDATYGIRATSSTSDISASMSWEEE